MNLQGTDRREFAELSIVAAGATVSAFAFLSHLALAAGVVS